MFRKIAIMFTGFTTVAVGTILVGTFTLNGCGGNNCVDHCFPGHDAVWCHLDAQTVSICGVTEDVAALHCFEAGGQWTPATVCDNPLTTYSETGQADSGDDDESWDPGAHVQFDPDTGEYVIEEAFFEALKTNPDPLNRDSTVITETETGHYRVLELGELADALGWHPYDIILSVNRFDLAGLEGFVKAYTNLSSNTSFDLVLRRGVDEVVLRYRVE